MDEAWSFHGRMTVLPQPQNEPLNKVCNAEATQEKLTSEGPQGLSGHMPEEIRLML